MPVQLRLDLNDARVDLLDEHRRVLRELLEAHLRLLDPATELALDVAQVGVDVRGVDVELGPERVVGVLRQPLAVRAHKIDHIIVLHVLVLDTLNLQRVVADVLHELLPRLLVLIALCGQPMDNLHELILGALHVVRRFRHIWHPHPLGWSLRRTPCPRSRTSP